MDGFYHVNLISLGSERLVAMDTIDLQWLVSLARQYGWRPQCFKDRHDKDAAALLLDPDPDGSNVVSARDALTLAAALEGAQVDRRLGTCDPAPIDNPEEIVRQMVALAAAGAFRAEVLRTTSQGR